MPVGVQCPISSSLGEFPSYWDWLCSVLGFRPYWCPSTFPSLSILGVIHSLLSTIGVQSCFFFTADVSPPFTHFLGEFPGLGLALVPDAVVPEADSGAHGAENSIQISALAGVESHTLASSGRAPLLLVASYDMQEATARQF